MDNVYLKAAIAGAFFALWPICMNRSGLNASASAFMLVAGVAAIVLPFALHDGLGASLGQSHGWWIVGACATCAVGNLCFGNALMRVTPQNLSSMFVMLVVAQVVVSAISQVIVSGQLSLAKAAGFVAACLAAYLLR